MKRSKKIFISYFLLLFLILSPELNSAAKLSLRITGRWTITMGPAELSAGSGSDFLPELESAINLIDIAITKTATLGHPWRMDIRKGDVNWSPNVQLFARRTSDGIGDYTIAGGTIYQEVTDIDQAFFSGAGDRSKIEIQLKLTGISMANLGVDTYTTTIYYTVTEL